MRIWPWSAETKAWTTAAVVTPLVAVLLAIGILDWVTLPLMAIWLAIAWWRGPSVTIGRDGLELRAFGARRALSFTELARVRYEVVGPAAPRIGPYGILLTDSRRERRYVVLELPDGREIAFAAPEGLAVHEAIVAAWRAHREARGTARE
jgi:hypothetical protein